MHISSICYPEVSLPQTRPGSSLLAFHVAAVIGATRYLCVALIGGRPWNRRRLQIQRKSQNPIHIHSSFFR